jgi:hypothetical protein
LPGAPVLRACGAEVHAHHEELRRAAVPELLSRGLVERADEIVIFDCGAGHKYPPPRS